MTCRVTGHAGRAPAVGLLLLLLGGCGTEASSGLGLPDSVLVEVIAEVHLADARADHTGQPQDSLRAAALAPFDLDTVAFQRMLDYYAEHPAVYAPLYGQALDLLIREQRQEENASDEASLAP